MKEDSSEVKVKSIVKDPKLSLKRFSQYILATENGKKRILQGCKYPDDYVPRFYELARKLACDFFSANYEDHSLYFDEFKKQAKVYRDEAKAYPTNKDGFKNRDYSANGLDALVAMSDLLTPILETYSLNSNLTHRKDSITINGVRIGAMADMLLFEDGGATHVGLLKFNFTTKKLSKEEADATIYILHSFFKKRGIVLDLNKCFLVDCLSWRVYSGSSVSTPAKIDKATTEIRENWDSI